MKHLFATNEQPKLKPRAYPSNPIVFVNGRPIRLMGHGLNALFMNWPKRRKGV